MGCKVICFDSFLFDLERWFATAEQGEVLVKLPNIRMYHDEDPVRDRQSDLFSLLNRSKGHDNENT